MTFTLVLIITLILTAKKKLRFKSLNYWGLNNCCDFCLEIYPENFGKVWEWVPMNITTRFEKHKLAPRNYLSRTPHSKGTFIFDGCVTRTRWAWAGMNQLGGSVIHLTKMRLSDWRKIATFSEPPASFHPNSTFFICKSLSRLILFVTKIQHL